MKTLLAAVVIATTALSFAAKADGSDYSKKKHYACSDVARQMVNISGDRKTSEPAYLLCSRSYDQASAGFSEKKAVKGASDGGEWAEAIVKFAYVSYSKDFSGK